MRCSKHLTDEKIRIWAFANKIYISTHAVWNDEGRRPQDLQIIVKYWGYKTKGTLLWSQKKQDQHLLIDKINQMYRYYYETYLENDKEIKI